MGGVECGCLVTLAQRQAVGLRREARVGDVVQLAVPRISDVVHHVRVRGPQEPEQQITTNDIHEEAGARGGG